MHRGGGQRLVFAAIGAATVVSCAVGGAYGAAWGIAYLVGEMVSLCTWRPLDDRGAHPAHVAAAVALSALIQTSVYVWLLSDWLLPDLTCLSVRGQLLGTVWGLLALAVVVALGRGMRLLRARARCGGGWHRCVGAGPRRPAERRPRE